MNFAHLKTFVAAAELVTLRRAASLCNLSQPAVSYHIAQLEAAVGAKLLNRAARRGVADGRRRGHAQEAAGSSRPWTALASGCTR